MRTNRYAGLVEPWKIRLITDRAKRRGFRGDELDEVVHRIVIELLDFRFDASRSNGAAEATAITALVDRQLAFYWRCETRYRSHVEAATQKTEPTIDTRCTFDEALDVQNAVAGLPEFGRRVCDCLSRGLSVNEVAGQLGVSWHTVNAQVQSLRSLFERLGLGPADSTDRREVSAA